MISWHDHLLDLGGLSGLWVWPDRVSDNLFSEKGLKYLHHIPEYFAFIYRKMDILQNILEVGIGRYFILERQKHIPGSLQIPERPMTLLNRR